MRRQVTVTADDYALTRNVTDTILAHAGALKRVSILANGLAFDYAIERLTEYPELDVAVHLNLTEGKALSDPKDVPHLAHPDGTFRHSSFRLLVLGTGVGRAALRNEVENELRLQVERVRSRLSRPLAVDGHQHVHMVPFVFSALEKLHQEYAFTNIRLPREPFFITLAFPFAYVNRKLVRHLGLNWFAKKHCRAADRAGMPHPDFFVGSLLSGTLTSGTVRSALSEVARRGGGFVEIGVHPGRSTHGALKDWKGDTAWYTSPWRDRETEMLADPAFRDALAAFEEDRLPRGGFLLRLARFGIVGVLAGALSLGILYALTEYAGVWYLLSAFIAYGVGIGVSFTLQKLWTFSHRSFEKGGAEFTLYLVNTLLCMTANIVGLYILVEYFHIWYVLAELIVIILVSAWSFFAYRFLIFRAA